MFFVLQSAGLQPEQRQPGWRKWVAFFFFMRTILFSIHTFCLTFYFKFYFAPFHFTVSPSSRVSPSAVAQLDVIGFNVMKKFIYAVETRGKKSLIFPIPVPHRAAPTSSSSRISPLSSAQVSTSRACTESSASAPKCRSSWAWRWVNTQNNTDRFKWFKLFFFSPFFFFNLLVLCRPSDPKTCADVELDNPEWEIKTITSAIKHYLRFALY